MPIYRIYDRLEKEPEKTAKYIETDMSQMQVADLAVGLQFFVEETTVNGDCAATTEDMASYLLCHFFGAKESTREKWEAAISDGNAPKEGVSIDLYQEREARCGKKLALYLKPIKAIRNTRFIKAVCSFYNGNELFSSEPIPAVEELLKRQTKA